MSGDMYRVWRTVILGCHPTAIALQKALKDRRCRVGRLANRLIRKTPLATISTSVALYRVTGIQLGLVRDYTTIEFFAAVVRCGFATLPAEVGPVFRLAYDDQPDGEIVRVGMEPIAGPGDDPLIFSVVRGGGHRWLRAAYADPTLRWFPERIWVLGRS